MLILGQGSGFVIAGKVESGSVQNNDRIILMPANEGGSIKGELPVIPYLDISLNLLWDQSFVF